MTDSFSTFLMGQGPVGTMGPMQPTTGIFGSGGVFNISQTKDILNVFSEGALDIQKQKAEAKAASINASQIAAQTKQELELTDKQRRLRAGEARAAAGASGTMGGSIFDIMASSAAEEELNLLNIKSTGELRESAYRNQAKQARGQLPFMLGSTIGKASQVLTKYKGI